MNRDESNDFDVVIVGAGPVGLTLANLLGVQGVRTLVLERNAQLEGEPRAVTIDDESLRTMQSAGLVDAVLKDVVQGYGVQYFAWNGKPLATIAPTRQEYGYAKRNAFRQPLLVRTLYEGLSRFPHVGVRFAHELTSFVQDERTVRCTIAAAGVGASATSQISASWLVACDGGRSPVRELCGVKLDGNTFPDRWLIVDLADRTLALRHTRTYCDPRRPAIRLPGPGGSLRYEFMLRPGDRDEDVLNEQNWRRWIAARVPEDADLPLVRKAIYGFHARVATRWKTGRVLLAGDAAHLTPPFAGQGLNSGIRDAANLAWKLAAVTRGSAADELLDTYEPERRPHAAALIGMALRIGAFMQPRTVLGAMLAQAALRAACLVPACRDYVLQLKFKPKPRFHAGYFRPSASQPYAELLPQPTVQHRERGLVRLDDLLGDGFAVLGWDSAAFRAAALQLLPPGMAGRAVALVRRDDDFLPECGERAGATLSPSTASTAWTARAASTASTDATDPTDPTAWAVSTAPFAATAPQRLDIARDVGGELAAILDARGAVALVVRPDRYGYRFVAAEELRRLVSPTSLTFHASSEPLNAERAAS